MLRNLHTIIRQFLFGLKKANSFRRNGTKNDGGIDNLLQSFGIDGLDKENHFNPNEDDISDWFGGAPGWLRRS